MAVDGTLLKTDTRPRSTITTAAIGSEEGEEMLFLEDNPEVDHQDKVASSTLTSVKESSK